MAKTLNLFGMCLPGLFSEVIDYTTYLSQRSGVACPAKRTKEGQLTVECGKYYYPPLVNSSHGHHCGL